MWHEARKQEKKIRGMMVDYKKRAERRREYYEKIKQDPAQFLQVHGRPCKIHLDPAVAQAADSPATMMPWQGHTDNMIDRFDVRAHLDIIPEYKPTDEAPKMSTAEMLEDRQSNYERYRALVQNDFLGVSEDKFLHQIYLEERYGPLVKPTSEEEKKKLADKKAAIGYVYEDSTPQGFTASAALSAVNNDDRDNDDDDDDKDDDLSDIDLDLAIEVDELTPSQCEEMNLQALAYGMKDDDFTKFLYQDKEEAEQLRLARELEEEKAMYSGRKSRRERRALREKKLQGRRITSPPSYAARESPTYKPFHRSHSSSRSRSHSPVNAGQITYITSFGDDGSEDEAAGPKGPPPKPASVKVDKIPTVSLPPSAKHHVSASSAHHHHRAVQQDTNATAATTKVSERTSRSSPPPTSSSRSQHHRSSRTRYRNQSSSDSRSSHSSYRDSSRRRKSSSSSYRHTRSRHRSRSRSTSSAGRSRSSSPRSDRSRSRSYRSYRHRRTRSKSRSRSRSDSRSRSRTPRSSKSRSRSHSWSKSRSQSERHHSHSHSPRLPTPPVRSYYRHSLSRSSSDLSSESEDDKNERSSTNTQSTQSASSTRPFPLLGKADPTAKKLTPQEKLKRKMQAALNRQYKADKRAQLQKIEKQQQEQQDRAEELREMAIKLRQRERERRHRMMEYDREHPSSYSSRQGRTEFSASGARDVDERSSRRPRHQSYERRRSSRSRSKSANSTSTSSDSRSRSRSRSRDRGRSRTPPSRRRHSDHRDHRRWGHRSRSRSRNRNGGRLVMGY